MVPFHPLNRKWNEVRDQAHAVFEEIGESSHWILGSSVSAFEVRLAELFAQSTAVGTGNGLDALEMALRAVGVKPGSKVLTTPFSAFATTLAILRAGAIPVFVDVDDSGLIDLDFCERALRNMPDLRAFLPVHLFGSTLDLGILASLRDRFELLLVEDCAQCIGATSQGIRAGSIGQACAVSFYPTKNLGALGDGGAVVSSMAEVCQQVKAMRDYGQSEKYVHSAYGMNSRIDELQAALLERVFLPRLSDWMTRRRRVARRYLAEIHSPRVRPLVKQNPDECVWHLFPVAVQGDREDFRRHLATRGIETALHYPRLIPEQPVMAEFTMDVYGSLVRASALARSEVSLPLHPWMQEDEISQVIGAVQSWTV